jgi:hypothetical protein
MNIEPVLFMFGAYIVAPLSLLFTVGTFATLIVYKRQVKRNSK